MRFWFFLLALLVIVGGVTLSNTQSKKSVAEAQGQISSAPVPPGAYLTEFLVENTHVPRRDPYAVYARLKGSTADLPRTVTKKTYQVGDTETFSVFDLQEKRPYQVTAVAVAVTPHVYMFVDVNSGYNRNQLAQLATDFENKIYPTTRRYFGTEAQPGVDNDPHLVILNTPLKVAIGYYSADDGQTKAINPNSNEREMFYIAANSLGNDAYLSVLAHEFQHMIHNNVLGHQDLWLNEGQSVLAQVLNGYTSTGYENSFLASPNTQLNAWSCGTCGTPRYYGSGYTFLSLLQEQFGFEAVRGISQNEHDLTGFDSVDYSLYLNAPVGTDHLAAFKQFVLANYLNRRSADPKYNYKNIKNRVEPAASLTPNTPRQESTSQYTGAYYTISGAGSEGFTLSFKGDTTVKAAGTGAKSGQMAWWTNKGDEANMTLTREVDLSGVQKATFQFSTWFDIEPAYDWLYIEVSADGGKTWQIVPGKKYTSDTNPTGKSFGPGLTGQSTANGSNLDDTAQVRAEWVQDSFDLSKWAGQKIKLRLEYLTDEGYNRQGALFDDFAIPEIGWRDDVESGENGWEASGFIRSNLTLPQKFFVQVIRRDGSCGDSTTTDLSKADNGQSCIQEMTLDATNSASQKFPYRQAVVIVAPHAPKTLNPAQYSLELK